MARNEAADLGKQLGDCEEQRDRANNRLNALNKSLCQLEEGKRGCDGRLASAQTALMLQVRMPVLKFANLSANLRAFRFKLSVQSQCIGLKFCVLIPHPQMEK